MSPFEATPALPDATIGTQVRRRLPGAAVLLSFVLGLVAAVVVTHAISRREYGTPSVQPPRVTARLPVAVSAGAAMVGQPAANAGRFYHGSFYDDEDFSSGSYSFHATEFCDGVHDDCVTKCDQKNPEYHKYDLCSLVCRSSGSCVKCRRSMENMITIMCKGQPSSCAYERAQMFCKNHSH